MAKLYGKRWKTVDHLPEGGQSFVYRVVDATGSLEGEFVLKRLKNTKRIARFRQEVEILRRLNDPHIVKLIDASVGEDEAIPHLVMPIAANGDLGGRIELYRGQLDSVVEVALQIAQALDHAHQNGVIHRDIKPGNILFSEVNHNVWVADFGISLDLQASERNTADGEVVGPAIFIAPELTEHGTRDVTAAADVYSLGQLIFYMLTGGRWVSQASVYDARYDEVFSSGDRHQLLRTLLSKMVTSLDRRYDVMSGVVRDLQSIKDWEKSRSAILLDPAAMKAAASFQRRAAEKAQSKARFDETRKSEWEVIDSISLSVGEMLARTLQSQAEHLKTMGFSAVVERNSHERAKIDTGIGSMFEQRDGASLVIRTDPNSYGYSILSLLACNEVFHSRQPSDEHYLGHPGNPSFSVIPRYLKNSNNGAARELGYIFGKSVRFGVRAPPPLLSAPQWRAKMFGNQYLEDQSAVVRFTGLDWPAAAEDILSMVKEALSEFIRYIEQLTR